MTTTAWLAPVRHLAPGSLERYLESQAAHGRHLHDVDVWSPLRLRFDDGEQAQVRYVVDRRANPAPADYYTFREDRGWDHVGAVGPLHVWRMEYTGERPVGFINDEVYRNAHRWSLSLGILAVVTLLGAVLLGIVSAIDPVDGASPRDFWAPAIAFAVVGVIAAVVSAQLSRGERPTAAERFPELVHH